jgi:hypothetical protein
MVNVCLKLLAGFVSQGFGKTRKEARGIRMEGSKGGAKRDKKKLPRIRKDEEKEGRRKEGPQGTALPARITRRH